MVKKLLRTLKRRLVSLFVSRDPLAFMTLDNAIGQKSLMFQYRAYFDSKLNPIPLSEVGLRVYSQHEEDGILLFIFALIGTTNKRCVEICAGDGMECNTANLIVNHRWIGLMFDGNEDNVRKAKEFYARHLDTTHWPPVIEKAWITKQNINQLISERDFRGDIDLLSLDIDGVDYWLWKDMDAISPRVVVLEFNHLWGPRDSVSVPYADEFKAEFTSYGSDYAGASLMAFVKLGKEKGYRLIGTNAIATNAFFVREDVKCDWLPEVSPESCFQHPRAQFGIKHRFPKIKDKEWVQV